MLWAHDGSDEAASALPHVAAIANAFGSEVILCSVIEVDDGVGSTETRPADGVVGNEVVALAAADLQREGVTRVRTLVMQGVAERAVADTARMEDVHLIVVGTRARSGVARAVIGSVSDAVTRTTPGIPVLVVHPADASDEDGADDSDSATAN
ncbi:MAG: universal stress protein [Chloroflexi bacterium]|nr:universal stress protein [Chloroflexota bacterium]